MTVARTTRMRTASGLLWISADEMGVDGQGALGHCRPGRRHGQTWPSAVLTVAGLR